MFSRNKHKHKHSSPAPPASQFELAPSNTPTPLLPPASASAYQPQPTTILTNGFQQYSPQSRHQSPPLGTHVNGTRSSATGGGGGGGGGVAKINQGHRTASTSSAGSASIANGPMQATLNYNGSTSQLPIQQQQQSPPQQYMVGDEEYKLSKDRVAEIGASPWLAFPHTYPEQRPCLVTSIVLN